MRFFAWLLTTFHVFDVVKGSASVAWSNTTSGDEFLSALNPNYAAKDCKLSPYCNDTGPTGDYDWHNDCPDFPRITYELWITHRAVDTPFLRKNLRHYEQLKMNPWKIGRDELTFPAYMAKRYAPNLPPSSMLCDGFGMCRAPSCKDIGEKLRPEEQRAAMLFFEFVSGLDHSFHITSEALQDHWRHILEDIDQLTRRFTYADEQQEAAIKKDEKKKKAMAAMELAFGIITAVFGLMSAGANIVNFRPEIVNKYINEMAVFKNMGTKWQRTLEWAGGKTRIPGSSIARKLKSRRHPEATDGGPRPDPSGFLRDKTIENIQKLWTITSGGYLGVQGLTKEVVKKIDHKKDLKGYDKTLEAVRAELVELDTNDIDEARAGMPILALGGRSRDGNNIVDLYEKDFFYGANVDFRAYVDFVVGLRTYATIISALWKTEGVYVVETWTKEGGDCDQDNRGPAENKICLRERPNISYWVYAMTNYKDKKNRSPPGWEYLTSEEGFHGLFASDVVRAALWREEVYWPEREKEERERNSTASGTCPSDNNDRLQDTPALEPVNLDGKGSPDTNVTHSSGSNSTLPPGARKRLDDYGNAPDAFDIAVCRSWMGEAISSTKSTDHNNAPCLCDPINPIYAASWEAPTNWTMAATKKFIKDSGLYNFDSFGKKCHDCDRMDVSWKALLQLDDEEEPAKHMKKAWLHDCDPNHHKEHDLGPPQLTNPNSTSSSSVPPGCDPTQAPTPTREPIMQVTTQLLNEETRYPKNTPKNITSQGACNGPYCIVDVVYEIRESHYNYTVDSSVRNGEYGCYPGNDKCVEQSAHDLCDFRDDDDDSEEAKAKEDAEWDREEVGPDDDEYEDFIQENPKGNGTAPGNDKTSTDGTNPSNDKAQNDGTTPGDNGAPGNGTSPDSQDKKKPDNEAMKAFKAWLKMNEKRQACVCGGNGKNGRHGIHCFPGPVATRTTTIKGRMSQTANPLSPLAATPTGAGGGSAAASGTGNVVTNVVATSDVWVDAREISVEMPSLGTPTETAVFLTGSYASIATYPAAGMH